MRASHEYLRDRKAFISLPEMPCKSPQEAKVSPTGSLLSDTCERKELLWASGVLFLGRQLTSHRDYMPFYLNVKGQEKDSPSLFPLPLDRHCPAKTVRDWSFGVIVYWAYTLGSALCLGYQRILQVTRRLLHTGRPGFITATPQQDS